MKKNSTPVISRRALLWWGGTAVGFAALAAALQFFPVMEPERHGPTVSVFKSPTCHCCSNWIEHLRDAGFKVDVHNSNSLTPLRKSAGVPDGFAACHTAFIEGYVIEGHVPAEDIQRLLTQRPKARGLAVPGMPIGSPGMEQGERRDRYDVLLFGEGQQQVYASHGGP